MMEINIRKKDESESTGKIYVEGYEIEGKKKKLLTKQRNKMFFSCSHVFSSIYKEYHGRKSSNACLTV